MKDRFPPKLWLSRAHILGGVGQCNRAHGPGGAEIGSGLLQPNHAFRAQEAQSILRAMPSFDLTGPRSVDGRS
ncbi:unnamed protein product [Linum trigynum]|uniref:Uncharacterized protein n=1 Tax=Linum trigynum TaxID=586398 RepID=A0AAV2FW93_9ROSI